MTGTKIELKTGLTREVLPLRDATFEGRGGTMLLMVALTIEPSPSIVLMAKEHGGWQDLYCDSPDSIALLIEHVHSRTSAKPDDPDWKALCITMAELLKASRAGIRAKVAAVQTKASRSSRWKAA